MAPTQTFSLLAITFSLLSLTSTVRSYNITRILSKYSEYSSFNSYLSQTKLADEINTQPTVTLLVLNNDAMSSLAAKRPLSVVKKVLSLLVLLDYYDTPSLQQISEFTTLSVTLYNTTMNAPGEYLGFVNITDLYGGKVAFGSAVSGSKLDSYFTKSVKQIPYNISVVEIDAPIIAPGVLVASTDVSNIKWLLEKAGCKTFAKMLDKSGVIKSYESAVKKGLTVFAPLDKAFKLKSIPDLTKLTEAEMVSLLEYHALPQYKPKGSLKINNKNKLYTLAKTRTGKFYLTTSMSGDDVVLHTGVDSSTLSNAVLDATPVVIFTVDKVLLPSELFRKSHSPAEGPSPTAASPSASPTNESPESPHSNSPIGLGNRKSVNAAVAVSSPSLFTALVTLVVVVVSVSHCY